MPERLRSPAHDDHGRLRVCRIADFEPRGSGAALIRAVTPLRDDTLQIVLARDAEEFNAAALDAFKGKHVSACQIGRADLDLSPLLTSGVLPPSVGMEKPHPPGRPDDTKGTTFKREGFPPPDRTGDDVHDMNEAAARSFIPNKRPAPKPDTPDESH